MREWEGGRQDGGRERERRTDKKKRASKLIFVLEKLRTKTEVNKIKTGFDR